MVYSFILKENYILEGRKMNLSNGRIWPYAIGASIIFIFGACVATIVVANTLPVEKSDTYMMDYHEADAKAISNRCFWCTPSCSPEKHVARS